MQVLSPTCGTAGNTVTPEARYPRRQLQKNPSSSPAMTPREIRKPLANPAGVTSSISREKSGKALEVVSGAGRLVAADVETHRVRHHQANRLGHPKPEPSHRADPIKILANSHPTGRLASGGPQAMNIGSAWRPSDRFSYPPFQSHRFYFILALHSSKGQP